MHCAYYFVNMHFALDAFCIARYKGLSKQRIETAMTRTTTAIHASDPLGLLKEAERLIEKAMGYDDEVYELLSDTEEHLGIARHRVGQYLEDEKAPNDDAQHRADYLARVA